MSLKKHGIVNYIIICLAVLSTVKYVHSSIYPSIYWNPWNPLFASDEPTINVRIGDTMNFLCPSDEHNFYIPSSHVNPVYENLYFLNDNKERFDTCNATDTRRLLNCDGNPKSSKIYTISFRDIQTSEKSLKFDSGKDYYLIGTGFRLSDRLNDVLDGSCRKSGDRGQYKLKLKIHVCGENEKCDICRSEGCYYQKNGAKCSNWTLPQTKKCPTMEKRTCTYPFLSQFPRTEYRPNLNVTECEDEDKDENVKQVVSRKNETEASTTEKGKLNDDDDNELLFKILVFVLGSITLILLLCLFFQSNYCRGITKILNSICFLKVGKDKNNEESHKLSGDIVDAEKASPRKEGDTDFYNDVTTQKTCRTNLLDPNDKVDGDIDATEKLKNISKLCDDLLSNISDELVKNKVQLIIDLLREMEGGSGIDDPDGRRRGGSDNHAYRNSMNTLPKKKTSSRSGPS